MCSREAADVLPRLLATLILLITLSMFVPLVFAIVALVHGAAIPPARWMFPLGIIAAGAVLMSLLSRKQVPLQLYITAFALWLLTAAYYWSQFVF